jgi:hypothetical protein
MFLRHSGAAQKGPDPESNSGRLTLFGFRMCAYGNF